MTDRSTTPVDQASRWRWLKIEIDGKTIRFWIVVALLITTAVLAFGVWWTYGWNHDQAATATLLLVAPRRHDTSVAKIPTTMSETADTPLRRGATAREQGA